MVSVLGTIVDLPVSQPRWVGQPMLRVEDPLLVTGQAEFTDNLKFTPAALYGTVNDALGQVGAEIRQLPMSPPRVWKAIQTAAKGRP